MSAHDGASPARADVRAAMSWARSIGTRLIEATTIGAVLDDVLDTLVEATDAEAVTLRVTATGPSGRPQLRLIGHRGLDAVHGSADDVDVASDTPDGLAYRLRRRTLLPIDEDGPSPLAPVERTRWREAGVRSIASVPLAGRDGTIVGTISTFSRGPREPRDGASDWLELLARQTAALIERERREAAMRSFEARQAFLLELSDAMRRLADPSAILQEASASLGRRLAADRVIYGEVEGRDDEIFVIRDEYRTPGMPSVVRHHRFDDYGDDIARALREGRTLAVADVVGPDATGSSEQRAAFRTAAIGAYIAVPLVKEGRIAAYLAVNQREPRDWTPDDVRLVEAVAERTWAAVERVRAEAARATSEERMRLAMEAAGLGSFVWFPQEDRTETDPKMLEIFGLPLDGSISLASALVTLIHVDDREPYAAAVGRAIDPDGEGRLEEVIRVVMPDGSIRWIAVTGLVTFSEHPRQAIRMRGVTADVTERYRAEAALRDHEARELERERKAREAAEGFLAVLSHELKTPVTTIYGGASMLARDPQSPHADEIAEDVLEESERLVRIIDDLLVLSRVERGAIPVEPEPLLLQREARHILDDIRRHFPSVTFGIDLPERLPPVLADPTGLHQILRNLITNAAKYAGTDGPVTVVGRERDGQVELAVLDEGPGPGDHPESLFDLFYRAPHSARRASGTGIGLYVARELAQAMGGRIEAARRGPDGGSRFTVALAIAPADEPGPMPDRDARPAPAARRGHDEDPR